MNKRKITLSILIFLSLSVLSISGYYYTQVRPMEQQVQNDLKKANKSLNQREGGASLRECLDLIEGLPAEGTHKEKIKKCKADALAIKNTANRILDTMDTLVNSNVVLINNWQESIKKNGRENVTITMTSAKIHETFDILNECEKRLKAIPNDNIFRSATYTALKDMRYVYRGIVIGIAMEDSLNKLIPVLEHHKLNMKEWLKSDSGELAVKKIREIYKDNNPSRDMKDFNKLSIYEDLQYKKQKIEAMIDESI